MFIRGVAKNTKFPEGGQVSGKDLQEDFQKGQVLQQQLKIRFRTEYLAQLVQRAKERISAAPRVGDIVWWERTTKKVGVPSRAN
jgi:hypothetical protein